MKVIVLCGFLGSGKTTVLLSLAKYLVQKHQTPEREIPVAIVENEIGEVPIDNILIQSEGYKTSTLFGGCVCCTLTSDLTLTVNKLAEQINPAYVIVEATGMAKPDPIIQTLRKYAPACEKVMLFGIADAKRWEMLYDAMEVLMETHLRNADVILLNKCDGVENSQIMAITNQLHLINPNAQVLPMAAISGIPDEIWDQIVTD